MIEVGVARPMVQGPPTIRTATAWISAAGRAGAGPKASRAARVRTANARMAGTNQRVILSTWSCTGCLRNATLAIRDVDPAAQVTGDLGRHQIEVALRERLAAVLSGIGYPPTITGDL